MTKWPLLAITESSFISPLHHRSPLWHSAHLAIESWIPWDWRTRGFCFPKAPLLKLLLTGIFVELPKWFIFQLVTRRWKTAQVTSIQLPSVIFIFNYLLYSVRSLTSLHLALVFSSRQYVGKWVGNSWPASLMLSLLKSWYSPPACLSHVPPPLCLPPISTYAPSSAFWVRRHQKPDLPFADFPLGSVL